MLLKDVRLKVSCFRSNSNCSFSIVCYFCYTALPFPVRRGVRSTSSPSVQLEGRNNEEEEEEEDDEQPMDVDERGRESSPLESTIDLGKPNTDGQTDTDTDKLG